jgi:hypothetical protein
MGDKSEKQSKLDNYGIRDKTQKSLDDYSFGGDSAGLSYSSD